MANYNYYHVAKVQWPDLEFVNSLWCREMFQSFVLYLYSYKARSTAKPMFQVLLEWPYSTYFVIQRSERRNWNLHSIMVGINQHSAQLLNFETEEFRCDSYSKEAFSSINLNIYAFPRILHWNIRHTEETLTCWVDCSQSSPFWNKWVLVWYIVCKNWEPGLREQIWNTGTKVR